MTGIIHRHLMATFLRNLAYTIVGAIVLFTMMDLLDHVGSFVDNKATASMVARYYVYKAAWIVDTVLPVAMLMATLFTVGAMARYLELTALFAAGRSLLGVTRPLVLLAVAVAAFSLAWREYVLPAANVERNRVWEVEVHRNPDRIRPTQNIALTGPDGRLYYARRFDPNTGLLTGLKIVTKDGAAVVERIDADRAEWDGAHWTLVGGVRRTFSGDRETIVPFDRLTARDLEMDPRSFFRDRIRPEDMNIRQLREHAELVRLTGGDATAAEVDIQFNLAFPLVNVIVVLMGIVLASGPRKTTIASGFGLTLLVSFGYYLFMNFGRALGHSGTIGPVPAAWSGNAAYALIFAVLWLRARR
ncbi:MAG: LptF/LptG family permease [Krumholzibacteria bacterium]|nr:LptF/LptG family permease [Candidatus Krumholzibacteria bacterium]